MPSVDDRVVQLTFENAKFEKGVSTSMNTLDKLDEKLKSGVSGTALLTLGKAATQTASNFTSLVKEVTVITGVARLASKAFDALETAITALPKQVITGGKTRALNIEQAKFQLSGLNVLWEDIYDNIDKAVSGTAYGLDEAAKVASQLVASGVKYGDATSDMAHALRGISGVAAMTNSSYEEIGSIFTTVAGQGKLMTMQLRQLEARGLNVAAKLGEQMGETEETIRDMVTKGKIDFITFANAMDEAFGEHATKANETFTGALSNMKAALSRIGADFATPVLTRTRDIFNSLRLAFNNVRTVTRPFAEGKFTTNFGKLVDMATKLIDSFDATKLQPYARAVSYLSDAIVNFVAGIAPIAKGMKEIWETIFPTSLGDTIAKVSAKVSRFSIAFRKALTGFSSDEEMAEAIGLGDIADEAVDDAKKTVDDVYSEIEKAVDEKAKEVIQGKYGNGDDRKAALEAEGYSYQLIQNRVNEMLNNAFRYAITEGDYKKMSEVLGLVFDETAEGAEAAGEAIANASEAADKSTPTAVKILNTFKGLVSVIDLVKSAFSAFKQVFIDPLRTGRLPKILSNILTLTSNWGASFSEWVQKIKEEGKIVAFFENIRTNLENAGNALRTFFDTLWGRAQQSEGFQRMMESFGQFAESFQAFKLHVLERFSDLMANINEQAEKLGFSLPEIAAGGVLETLLSVLDWIFDKISAIVDFVAPAIDWISTKLDGLLTILNSINLSNFMNGSGPLFGISFSEVFGTPTEIANNFFNSLFSLFGQARDTVSPIIRSITDGVIEFISNIEALTPVVDTVTNTIDSAKDTAESIIGTVEGVHNAIDTVTSTVSTVTDVISDAEETIAPAIDTVSNFIDTTKGATDSIGHYLGGTRKAYAPSRALAKHNRLAAASMLEYSEAAEGAAAIVEYTSNAMDSMGESAVESGDDAKQAFSWLSSFNLSKIGSWLLDVGRNFADWIATMTHGEISGTLSSITAIVGITALAKVFKNITEVLGASGKVLEGLGTSVGGIIKNLTTGIKDIVTVFTDGFKDALKTIRRAQTSKILLSLAVVIAVIVGSIWLISTIPVDGLNRAVVVVGAVLILVTAIAITLTKISTTIETEGKKTTSNATGVAALLVALGLVVLALVGAVKILDGVRLTWELGGKLVILAAMVTGMVFAVKALSKVALKSIRSGIGSAILLLSFAAAIALLAKALQIVAKANFTGIGDNLVVILMALGMLALVAKAIGKGGFGRALGLTLMIADIWLIVWALQSLAKVNTAQLLKAIPAFIEVVIAMGVMMAVTQLAGKHAAGAGIGILAMTVSLLIVARALKKLAAIDESDLKKSTRAVEGILFFYALIIAASKLAKGGALLAAGASFLLLSVAINILYFAVKNMAKLAATDPNSLLQAVLIIDTFMVFFALFEGLSGLAKPGKLITTAVSFGLVLLAIFGVFWLLKRQNMSGAEMQAQANAIIQMLGALLFVVAVIADIGQRKGVIKEAGKGILVVDIVIGDLVLLIGLIGYLTKLTDGIGLMSNGIKILSMIGDFIKEYGVIFGIVIGAIVALGAVLGLAVKAGLGVDIAIGIGIVLGAIDVIVANFALLFGAIGELTAFDNNAQDIENGIEVVENIAGGLGRLVGAISGGFEQAKLEQQGEGVEELATSLETASTGVQAFSDAVSGLKTSSINDISTLIEAVSGMSEIGKNFNLEYAENFKQALNAYGPAAATFFSRMESSGVDPTSAEKFSAAMASLSEIAAFGAPGAFDSDQFASFINSLRAYLSSLVSILLLLASDSFVFDEAKFDSVVSAGKKLAEIYDSIPETGGLTQKIFGEESLTQFAEDIKGYVWAIKAVNAQIVGFEPDTDAWTHFVDIGTKFNTFLNDLGYVYAGGVDGKQISLVGWFAGSTSLETFAQDIADYVEGIIAVNDVLVGLNEKMVYAGSMVGYIKEEKDYEWSDAWDTLVTVGQKMSELYKSLPGYMADEDAGFFERITAFLTRNKDGMATFGQDLGGYIDAMVSVNDQINESGLTADNLNTDVLDAVADVARSFTDIATTLSDTNISTIGTLGNQLGDPSRGFIAGFQNFYNSVTTMDMSVISAAIADMKTIITDLISLAGTDTAGIENLSAVSSALGNLGDTFATAFATSFAQNAGALIEIGSGITASIGEGILQNAEALTTATSDVSSQGATSATEQVGLYELAGIYLMTAMATTMGTMGSLIWKTGYTLAGYGVSGVSSKYTNFWYAGYYMARGVINGIKSQNSALYYAGAGMANQALQGVTDTASIHSPSEVTTQYGQYLGQGLANGMMNSEGVVADAAKDTATTALGSLNSVIAHVYDILSGALDYDFTIRPVLDLSAVREGVSEMGGLFGTNRYNLGTNTYVPRVAVGRNQNADISTPTSKVELTNNFYVQKMDEGQIDYFVNRVNRELGARV